MKKKDLDYSGSKDRIEGECLSTDTKPTKYANGSVLIEMDTGDKFMFDEANQTWLNITNPGGGGDAEVWLVGDEPHETPDMVDFVLRNVGETDHITELYTNPNNYDIYLNGVNLPYRIPTLGTDMVIWGDNSDESQLTKMVQIMDNGSLEAEAVYLAIAEAPTSVEVSVKAK